MRHGLLRDSRVARAGGRRSAARWGGLLLCDFPYNIRRDNDFGSLNHDSHSLVDMTPVVEFVSDFLRVGGHNVFLPLP